MCVAPPDVQKLASHYTSRNKLGGGEGVKLFLEILTPEKPDYDIDKLKRCLK